MSDSKLKKRNELTLADKIQVIETHEKDKKSTSRDRKITN